VMTLTLKHGVGVTIIELLSSFKHGTFERHFANDRLEGRTIKIHSICQLSTCQTKYIYRGQLLGG
ncbi:hypothetical protein L9F63_010286, partial [Diploptera punctata]